MQRTEWGVRGLLQCADSGLCRTEAVQGQPGFPAQRFCFSLLCDRAPVVSTGESFGALSILILGHPGAFLKRHYRVLPDDCRFQGDSTSCYLVSLKHSLGSTTVQRTPCINSQEQRHNSPLFHDVVLICLEALCCCLALVKYTVISFSLGVYMQRTHFSCFYQGFPWKRTGVKLRSVMLSSYTNICWCPLESLFHFI